MPHKKIYVNEFSYFNNNLSTWNGAFVVCIAVREIHRGVGVDVGGSAGGGETRHS